jgi:heme O synthase-like polyprenyltransferase
MFLWQMPHFLAIAWLYRDDYAHAGIPLLSVLEPDGRRTGQQALIYAAALWPVSLLPAAIGLAGLPYLLVATALGLLFVWLALRFARHRSMARRGPRSSSRSPTCQSSSARSPPTASDLRRGARRWRLPIYPRSMPA